MQYNPEELKEILNIFKAESDEIIQELNDEMLIFEQNQADKEKLKKILQLLHSLKSAARMLGYNGIQDVAHKLEDVVSAWKTEKDEINPNCFEEIYKVFDLLGFWVAKSVETKGNYITIETEETIKKLDSFIKKEHSENTKEKSYIEKISTDVNAILLELIFVLQKDEEDSAENILSIVVENLKQLKEMFCGIEYINISKKIREITEYISVTDEKEIDFSLLKEKIWDIRNEIYTIFKGLNIVTNDKSLNTFNGTVNWGNNVENSVSENKNEAVPKEPENGKSGTEEKYAEILPKFDFVLSNLQKIKTDKNIIHEIVVKLKEIIAYGNKPKIELVLSKTIGILSLFEDKNITTDNDVFMVILQCIYLAKRIYFREKEENINNLNFLIQRLSVVEDMFNITDISSKQYLEKIDNEKNLLNANLENAKNSSTLYDFQEIKTLRVDTKKIDNLISQTGELLINGIKTGEHLAELSKINYKLIKWSNASKKIINYFKYMEKRGFFLNDSEESALLFYKKIQNFCNDNYEITNELTNDFNSLYKTISEDDNKFHQNILGIDTLAKSIRVLPLATIFHSFPRMVRDIAKEKEKKIDFLVTGSDTTVDKKIIEEIKTPLIHIIRNAVSHGIELPEERLRKNKKETGSIKLSAKQVSNNVIITIEDDGYGINLEKVKQTALEKGLLTNDEADNISDEYLLKLLFLPGFSTQENISDISGRGIGLDIVKTKITNLNGEINIDSVLNKGCRVTIKLPVSMSTIKTFVIKVGEQNYAIPISSVKFVKEIKKDEIYNKNGQACILFEEHSIPVYALNEVFNEDVTSYSQKDGITVIIVEAQEKQAAYIVEKLTGDQEVFQKKLVPPILQIKNISGFTTLSSGEICLIINPFELIRNTVLKDYTSFLSSKTPLAVIKEEKYHNKKIVILNNETDDLSRIKQDLENCCCNVSEFNNINSVYDFIIKNKADMLICKLNKDSNDVIRLIKYIRSDENYKEIKIIIFSDMLEYEVNELVKEYGYNYYEKQSLYKCDEFVNKIKNMLLA